MLTASNNYLFRNQASGSFAEIQDHGLRTPDTEAHNDIGRKVVFGDYDGDGDLDVFVVNEGTANALYMNTGRGPDVNRFVKVTGGKSFETTGDALDAAWGDLDNVMAAACETPCLAPSCRASC